MTNFIKNSFSDVRIMFVQTDGRTNGRPGGRTRQKEII